MVNVISKIFKKKITENFYKTCISFDEKNGSNFLTSRQLYECYLNFKGINKDSPKCLTLSNFLLIIKKEHPELGGLTYCQRHVNGESEPKWGFKFISFTDEGLKFFKKSN